MTACEEKIYNDVDSTLFRCALHCIIVHLSGTDFNNIADIIYKDFAISYMSCIKHIPGSISLRNWPLKQPWITSLKNESNTRNQIEDYIASFEKNCEQNIPATAFLWGYDSMGRPVDTLNLGYKNAQKALKFCIDSDLHLQIY